MLGVLSVIGDVLFFGHLKSKFFFFLFSFFGTKPYDSSVKAGCDPLLKFNSHHILRTFSFGGLFLHLDFVYSLLSHCEIKSLFANRNVIFFCSRLIITE